MDFQLHPLKGVNDIEFGMTMDMVRARMTGTRDTFDRHKNGCLEDMYDDIGASFSYDLEGHLEFCQFFRPARAWLGGIDVLGLTMAEVVVLMKRLDPSTADEDDTEPTAFDLAMAPWSDDPDGLGDQAVITVFGLGKPGYYDEFRPGQPEEDIWDMAKDDPDLMYILIKYLGERPKPTEQG